MGCWGRWVDWGLYNFFSGGPNVVLVPFSFLFLFFLMQRRGACWDRGMGVYSSLLGHGERGIGE